MEKAPELDCNWKSGFLQTENFVEMGSSEKIEPLLSVKESCDFLQIFLFVFWVAFLVWGLDCLQVESLIVHNSLQ